MIPALLFKIRTWELVQVLTNLFQFFLMLSGLHEFNRFQRKVPRSNLSFTNNCVIVSNQQYPREYHQIGDFQISRTSWVNPRETIKLLLAVINSLLTIIRYIAGKRCIKIWRDFFRCISQIQQVHHKFLIRENHRKGCGWTL